MRKIGNICLNFNKSLRFLTLFVNNTHKYTKSKRTANFSYLLYESCDFDLSDKSNLQSLVIDTKG